ncbi:Vacuolar protein sorting-associated protein 62 [Heracleum sosnowskyi]|uniref:Vacuolar protein sorting-associated protein 62 n=1 Tax=Heracleum sosnowskyi TaxID=360622 RepID=A0AAD8MGH5_9APIA|nr:Vacuolar protein sorting-associated protein 62 [Heracleum sosnowskyi]
MESTKVNCRLQASSPSTKLKKDNSTLFIKTIFKLPAPVPKWPPGTSFASGIIDLGALHVSQTTSFEKVWATYEGGLDNQGATFYEPSSIPEGFFMLGCYSQPNNQSLFGWVLVAKDVSSPGDPPGLTLPIDYTLVWSSESPKIKQDDVGYFWLPVPPDGYTSVGHIVTTSPQKPSLDKVRVVRSVLTESAETDTWIWGANSGFNVYSLRPVERGSKALGLSVGTFIAKKDGEEMTLSGLKNLNLSYPSMPNLDQVQALIQAYAPVVYLHPDEKYFPSSVSWFFQNGALLYTKGQESNPVQIAQDGSNLPQNGSNDGTYWIDLPTDKNASEGLQKGNLQSAEAYVHIKPALGGTFTDIAVWIFCPFNGPGKIKIAFFTISLGEIGEHVSDWEHVTLRVSNFNGELQSVYYSAHSKGMWVSAPNLEFENNNKPIVYASLYGHASYPHAGTFIHDVPQPEKIIIGARNDTSKSNFKMDTAAQFSLVGADYLGGLGIVEPPWLNYAREWGPKRELDLDKRLKDIEKVLPGKLKDVFDRFVRSLPPEALGQEGPTGPKWKDNWSGDERD